MKKIFFATGNTGKVQEMRPLFQEQGFQLEQVEVDIDEIQSRDVEKVAREKVKDSLEASELSEDAFLIVEDTGFYVKSLNGFPGAQASFFAETVGVEKLPDLMEDEDDREAYFKTAIACVHGEEFKVFTGKVNGTVPEKKKGDSHPHLPYNSYFIAKGYRKSFAEKPELIEKESHREEATEKLLEWLNGKGL